MRRTNDRFTFLTEVDLRTDADPAPRASEREPATRRAVVTQRTDGVQQQHLGASTAGEPTDEPRVNHRRFVKHEEIVGAQYLVEFAKESMLAIAIVRNDEEPALVALERRVLGNRLAREREIVGGG